MSSINPNNINGQYPIAGQDNDSQGFRDNFTNVKNNLTFAKSEIEALEQNAILKTALPGITLNNEMNNTQLKGVQSLRFTETIKDVGTIGSATTVNWTEGHFQFLTLSQSTALTITGWPTNQLYAKLRLEVTVSNTDFTLTLPSQVANGLGMLANANVSTKTISFNSTDVHLYEFTTYDNGTTLTVIPLIQAQ
jgi:hypothetical protein